MTEGDEKKTTKRASTKKAKTTSRAKRTTKKTSVKKTATAQAEDAVETAPKTKAKRTRAARPKASGGRRLRVKQVRSTIHRQKRFLRTLSALGLKHHQDEVVVTDSPSVQGMLTQVRSFVRVTPEDG